MRVLGGLLMIALLAGCTQSTRLAPPEVVTITRNVVQPVPPELLREHPIPVGGLAECPQIAAQRADEIRRCNSDKAAIKSLGEHQ